MKQYNTIYVDPPWTVQGWSMRAVQKLPIREFVEKEALILYWPTTMFLPENLKILESWGFRYATMLTWRKGMSVRAPSNGYCDHLILGVKGLVKWESFLRYDLHDVKKPKGSRKPEYFRDLLGKTARDSFERPTYLDVFGGFWREYERSVDAGPWEFLKEDVLREAVGTA